MSLNLRRFLVLLCAVAGITAGCGLKGDLYLPVPEAPAAAPAEDDEDKEGSQQPDTPDATDSEPPVAAP